MLWDLLIKCWPLIISAIIGYSGYLFGRWKEKKSKIENYDKSIFTLINDKLDGKVIYHIIAKSQTGYLPLGTFDLCDYFDGFIKHASQRFINDQLNNKFDNFVEHFVNLGILYSGASCGGYLKPGDPNSEFKLLLDKDGDQNYRDQIFKDSLELSRLVEDSYNQFRTLIKNTLYI